MAAVAAELAATMRAAYCSWDRKCGVSAKGAFTLRLLKDQVRNDGGSCSTSATIRPGICCASQRPTSPASNSRRENAKKKTFKENRENRTDVEEEDIYTIEEGWKVHINPTEEMIEIAGVQVPVRLKQQLQSERRATRIVEKTPAEAPRLTHKLLRVMAGKAAGKKLTSPSDSNVRPMMEVVRGAVFNILQALSGWSASSPSGRWLDLYSGTGSVAIEGLSRGCVAEAHFVEMDPWVISKVLQPNLEETHFATQSTIHTSKVENLLQQVSDHGAEFLGGAFDFVSVTPPYEAVSYTVLMEQLSKSPILSENTFMIVEYPLRSRHEMPDSCGKLFKIRDRKYGRTNVAIYGPEWAERD